MAAKDTYFQGQDGVLKVFDFDYEAIEAFNWEVQNNTAMCGFISCLVVPCIPCAVMHFMFGKQNMDELTRGQHLCITRDGIRYVVDKHKTGCRLDCQDQGKVTKTVPFDKLTDCDIEEPAGAMGPPCCMTQRVLHTVNVDTASGNRGGGENGLPTHELELAGLVDASGFKEMVWQCKRGEFPGMGAPHQQAMGGGAAIIGQSVGDASELAGLLQRGNELLEQISANTKR